MAVSAKRTIGDRPLTLGEKFLAALTAALAVATLGLAAATSARAGAAGVLPGDGPYVNGPQMAISHAEGEPLGVATDR